MRELEDQQRKGELTRYCERAKIDNSGSMPSISLWPLGHSVAFCAVTRAAPHPSDRHFLLILGINPQWSGEFAEKPPVPSRPPTHVFRRSVEICRLQGMSNRCGDESVPRESRMFIAGVWGRDVRIQQSGLTSLAAECRIGGDGVENRENIGYNCPVSVSRCGDGGIQGCR